jgi:hypothetical protein
LQILDFLELDKAAFQVGPETSIDQIFFRKFFITKDISVVFSVEFREARDKILPTPDDWQVFEFKGHGKLNCLLLGKKHVRIGAL